MNEEVKEKEIKEETTNNKEEKKVEESLESDKNKKEKKDRFKKEIDALNNENDSLKEELKKFKDKYYRAIADLDNQRKQYDKEYRQALKYASQNLAEKLLPSFEMFSMVIESVDNLPSEVIPYVQGFDMVYRQMIQALESEGVSEIKVKVGDEFDHNIHSALETQEVEDESLVNKIIKVIRKGYKIHDRLLKPATVIVGKSKEVEVKNEETQAKA
ncbi:MAG: nucleotide exchange factor GrpE [Erysipelotrichaceae bacterium]|nr:nucleotide exchange factor GrpE [Erysipelotrichaceae bacterium]